MSVIGKQTKSRGSWLMNPVTKIKDSKKNYNRKRNKKETNSLIKDSKGW
jgi:hypothetical protein